MIVKLHNTTLRTNCTTMAVKKPLFPANKRTIRDNENDIKAKTCSRRLERFARNVIL